MFNGISDRLVLRVTGQLFNGGADAVPAALSAIIAPENIMAALIRTRILLCGCGIRIIFRRFLFRFMFLFNNKTPLTDIFIDQGLFRQVNIIFLFQKFVSSKKDQGLKESEFNTAQYLSGSLVIVASLTDLLHEQGNFFKPPAEALQGSLVMGYFFF